MKTSPIGLAALVVGCATALIGLGAYQAWWTIAFALGGFVIALQTQQAVPATRSIVIGAAAGGSALLAGMSLFLLYGSGFGGALWLVAAIASGLLSILLLVVGWLLRRTRSGHATLPDPD